MGFQNMNRRKRRERRWGERRAEGEERGAEGIGIPEYEQKETKGTKVGRAESGGLRAGSRGDWDSRL